VEIAGGLSSKMKRTRFRAFFQVLRLARERDSFFNKRSQLLCFRQSCLDSFVTSVD
jgi:hypothetical protein